MSPALSGAGHWCEILMLHLNTKYCRADTGTGGAVLARGAGGGVGVGVVAAGLEGARFFVAPTAPLPSRSTAKTMNTPMNTSMAWITLATPTWDARPK